MKIPYFLKFGLKATILFFAILIVTIAIENYFFSPDPGNELVKTLFIILRIPVFVLSGILGITTKLSTSTPIMYFLLFVHYFFTFLYFLTIFSIGGIAIDKLLKKKKINIR